MVNRHESLNWKGATMSRDHKVEIDLHGHGKGSVKVDGRDFHVVSADVHMCVGEPNTATLELLADEVTFSGPAEVVVAPLRTPLRDALYGIALRFGLHYPADPRAALEEGGDG